MLTWSGYARKVTADMGDLTLEARKHDNGAGWRLFAQGIHSGVYL